MPGLRGLPRLPRLPGLLGLPGRRPALLLVASLLAACQLNAPTPPRATRSPAPAPAGASPKASARPTGAPASKAPAPAAAVMLAPPAQGAVTLSGTLRVDPTYLVAAGAGNILSHNGGQIVAAGGLNLVGADGGSLVGADGGSLVGADGGSLVAAGAGNVVAVTGSQIVAAGGLNMVAAGGGNIVAAGGLNMVAAGAGNLVAAGAGNYALAQAAAAPGPAASTELPAAGMLVSVVSLSTRRYLPIGKTPTGEDVYAVYSNAQGGFAVTVPAGEETNVMVVASLPGRQEAGTILNAITPPQASLEVDEDAATVTRYLRRVLVGRIADIIAADSLDEANQLIDVETGLSHGEGFSARDQLKAILVRLREIAAIAPGQALGSSDRAPRLRHAEAIAQAIVDAAVSRLSLRDFTINPAIVPEWAASPRKLVLPGDDADRVLPILARCFEELRTRAEVAMRDPAGGWKPFGAGFFQRVAVGSAPDDWFRTSTQRQDWFAQILERYPTDPYPISKPSQVGDFLVDRYMAVNRAFVYEPVLTAYMLLDPAPHAQVPSTWETNLTDDVGRAAAQAALDRINQKFPGLNLSPADPQFSVARRLNANKYAFAYDAVGLTLFVELGFAMTNAESDAARAVDAAVRALVLPAAGG